MRDAMRASAKEEDTKEKKQKKSGKASKKPAKKVTVGNLMD